MARERLIKSVIDAAQARERGDLFLWDAGKGAVTGFGLKVTPKGGKTFVLQYRMRGAKHDRRIKIGKYGVWTVERARDRARELRREIDAGTDPFDKRAAEHRAREEAKRLAVDRSFETVAGRFLEHYRAEPRASGARKGKLRSARTIEMMEGAIAYLKDKFGQTRIDQIGSGDLRRAIEAIPAANQATRRNTDACARILWKWAAEQEEIDSNPFDTISRRPAVVASRERVLDDAELGLLWSASLDLDYPVGPYFRLLILTGQRRAEVAAMSWSELDKGAREWCIPASRAKNGIAHIVPLSDAVVAELDALAPKDEWPPKGLVLTTTGETAFSGFSRAKALLDAGAAKLAAKNEREAPAEWRVHDLRRTLATGMQRLGIRLEVTEAVLNHVSGSRGGLAGVYQRHDWKDEKRVALEAWAAHVERILKPEEKNNVVSLDAAKRSTG